MDSSPDQSGEPLTVAETAAKPKNLALLAAQGLLTLLLLAAIVKFGFGFFKKNIGPTSQKDVVLKFSPRKVEANGNRLFGTGTEPYTLVEFMDFECPPCRATAPQIASLLQKNPGKMGLIIRNFPLSIHPMAFQLACYMEAASELGKYIPFHDAVLSPNFIFSDEGLKTAAKQCGINWQKLSALAKSKKVFTSIKVDLDAASQFQLPGTPTFILIGPHHHCTRLASLQKVSQVLGSNS